MAWIAQVDESKEKLMKKYCLTDAMLKQKCSKNDVLEIKKFVPWKFVGPYLSDPESGGYRRGF